MKFGVVIFPGSNCDRDIIHVLKNVMGQQVELLWHKDTVLPDFQATDCIMLPGGFSYGDYLRPGAISRFSPIMETVIDFANLGGKVWGICNGFQMLCESGLLPGALLRNDHQLFRCENVFICPATTNSSITSEAQQGQPLKIPIAHADGRYYADQNTIENLETNDQVLFRYCNENGEALPEFNPNGSINNIAGICNESRNVFGMMPHPERASEEVLGNIDGRIMFESLTGISAQVI